MIFEHTISYSVEVEKPEEMIIYAIHMIQSIKYMWSVWYLTSTKEN